MVDAPEWTPATIEAQLAAAMRSRGIEPPARFKLDGSFQRFRVPGDDAQSKNGFYVVHMDGWPGGFFGCWKRYPDGEGFNWKFDAARKPTRDETAAMRAALKRAAAEQEKAKELRHAEARRKAARLWEKAKRRVPADYPYLQVKQAKAYGLRLQVWGKPSAPKDSALLVPVRDADGELHGLQYIRETGAKRFLTGTSKAGHFHHIAGEGPGADVVAVGEGYATLATVRELMGWTCYVAWDAGNLRSVAEVARKRHSGAVMVVVADNDHSRKDNPGAVKGREAARVVGAAVALPEFGPDDAGTDWNDYRQGHGAEQTRKALAAALAAAPVASEAGAGGDLPDFAGVEPHKVQCQTVAAEGGGEYRLQEDGLYYYGGRYVEGRWQEDPPLFICSPLRVVAIGRDLEQTGWARLLEFHDIDGTQREHMLPMRILGSKTGEKLCGELLDAGLPRINQRASQRLAEYLMNAQPTERVRTITRAGWHGGAFVLPSQTVGDTAGERYLMHNRDNRSHYVQAGTLEAWRMKVSQPAAPHVRLRFAIAAAFAGPLLYLLDLEPGAFHFIGNSSQGKTTAVRLASSVWGHPFQFIRQWNVTQVGLEAAAEDHNDNLLCLDDINQADPKDVQQMAYLLGNGAGKGRGNRDGSARTVRRFRTVVLSTGEVGSASRINEAGQKSRAGNEIRLVEVDAEAGDGLGIFNKLSDGVEPGDRATALVKAATQNHGHAGVAFLERLTADRASIRERGEQAIHDFLDAVLGGRKADGQVLRVAKRFAVVNFAAILASEYGITGWRPGLESETAEAEFHSWVERRGGYRNQEPEDMVRQVRQFFEAHGGARFQSIGSKDYSTGDGGEESEVRVINRAGFRKTIELSQCYLTFPEIFRNEVCAGFDYRRVCEELLKRGVLRTNAGSGFQLKTATPLGNRNMYCVVADRLLE